MSSRWKGGNSARLLENGEDFFPAVFKAIRGARREVVIETFILFEDKVGMELQAVMIEAAARGVHVDILVDGFGASDLTPEYVGALTAAGVRLRTFDPSSRVFGIRFNVLRRMHRKLVVVDAQQAFVGGINYSADHLGDFGPQAKQDYAVELRGPIVADIHTFVRQVIRRSTAPGLATPALTVDEAQTTADAPGSAGDGASVGQASVGQASVGPVEAIFVTRDNHHHRTDIERYYRAAIRSARKRVVIANAYFFPGYRLLREMRRAARRGVQVDLILQGEPDMPIVKKAAGVLYDHLQRDGVRIHEYCKRPFHGKVAVVDDDWSTVGSSNLDPLSLALNLEANVILRDAAFADVLRSQLDHLIANDCRVVKLTREPKWPVWQQLRSTVVFHFLRHFPSWAQWLPRHVPRLKPAHAESTSGHADAR
ncbi:MAG: cardiolipin synthase ClsB [Burkholderiaceae bacterium]